MLAVKTTNMLSKGAFPGYRHRQEKRIEPVIGKPFAKIASSGENEPFLIVGDLKGRLGSFALGGRHPAPEDNKVPYEARKAALKVFEMVPSLRQHDRGALRFQSLQHIIEDQIITRLVAGDRSIDSRHRRTVSARQRRRQLKHGRPVLRAMNDSSTGRLDAGVNAVTNGTELHEDNRVVAILARHGRRQAEHIAGLSSAGYKLKARRGQVMAFVNDKMTIVRDEIRDFALPHETLD